MWRVVLDNAALTSALLNPHGSAARLLDYAYEGRLRLFATDRMITCETRVLRHALLAPRHGLLKKEIAELVRDLSVLLCLVPDTGDNRRAHSGLKSELIKCATLSHADFIVTSAPLPAQEVQHGGTQIVKADQLVKLVGRGL